MAWSRVPPGALLTLLVSVLALSLGGCSSTVAPEHPSTEPVGTPEVSEHRSLDAQDLVGDTWRLLPPYQPGRRGPESTVDPGKGTITFGSDTTWAGSDGCNAENGTFRLVEGRLRLRTTGVMTAIGCDNLSPRDLLHRTFITVDEDRTHLLARDARGNVVAEYGR